MDLQAVEEAIDEVLDFASGGLCRDPKALAGLVGLELRLQWFPKNQKPSRFLARVYRRGIVVGRGESNAGSVALWQALERFAELIAKETHGQTVAGPRS